MGIQLVPVFAGKTPDGESIVLYKNAEREDEIHLQRPDGELCALSPGFSTLMWFDMDRACLRIRITSPEWSGTASGTDEDLLQVEPPSSQS